MSTRRSVIAGGRRPWRTVTQVAIATGVAGGLLAFASGSVSAIVEGDPTAITATPWQVSLRTASGEHLCGGSIISERIVLTAAHCLGGESPATVGVRAGVTNQSDVTGQDRGVTRFIVHPAGFEGSADLALLVLDEPLRLTPSVQPIALASNADATAATTGLVSGWGDQGEEVTGGSEVLLSAEVPMLTDVACSQGLAPYDTDIVAEKELCAEGVGAGSCYGDSGGPLVVFDVNGAPKLAGVVSWGAVCGTSPGVFAEVPAFTDWIANGIAAGTSGTPLSP